MSVDGHEPLKVVVDASLGRSIIPECCGVPFDPISNAGAFWSFLEGSVDLFQHWFQFLAVVSDNEIMKTLQNGGLQENIFNYSLAALWASKMTAGLNSLVAYFPSYSGNVEGVATGFADVGTFLVTHHSLVEPRLAQLVNFQTTMPINYSALREACTFTGDGPNPNVCLKPSCLLETKFLRKSKFSTKCAVSAHDLYDDMEKLRKILAVSSSNRTILPLALWLIDCGEHGHETPIEGISNQPSLSDFLAGDWMLSDRLRGGLCNNPYEYLSAAMGKPLLEPHFQIVLGEKTQKVWIHRLAFLRFPNEHPRFRLLAFLPCKIEESIAGLATT